MKGTMRHRKVGCLLYGLLVAMPQIAVGAQDATITVKVSVVAPPPCLINNNQPITVEFGDVMTTRVDGNNYRRPLNYTLSCTAGFPNAMKLQVVGNSASFDRTVLWTSQNGLGIQLQQGSTKLPINTWLNFNYPNKPVLWAVPVKQPAATLKEGEFAAGATMKVDYQ